MKKLLKLLPLLLIAVCCAMITACDDKDDKYIDQRELPASAKDFVNQYFSGETIITTEKDHDEYEVCLSDGTRIDFTRQGEWKDVDAPTGKTIPGGFYPASIDAYIAANMNGMGINEISKERRGYDIELLNGLELIFSSDGAFLAADPD